MARRPYYLSQRDGIYYARLYNSLTGRLMPARSTGERNLSRAHSVAAQWFSTGTVGVKKSKVVNLSDLMTFDALVQGLKTATLTGDQARRLVATLDTRGLLADEKTASNRGLVAFLLEFYSWEKSPFVREKLQLGQKISKTHCLDMTGRVNRSWKPFFGDKRLADVTRAELKAFGQKLAAEGLAAASINKTVMVGKTALGWCKREGILPTNPADGLAQYKGEAEKRGILTEEEYSRLLGTRWEDERAAVAVLVAATAGLRIGEILALTAEDIGEDRLMVRGSFSNVEREVKSPKSGKARQAVLLPNVRRALLALVGRNPHATGRRFVFWASKKADVPTDRNTIIDAFRAALRSIGIPDQEQANRNLDLHGLRHLHAARLADLVDLRAVALSTGHAGTAMAAHYASHADESHFQAVVSAVKVAFPEASKSEEF